ncbi:MAG TPA: hypothetical protein VNX70_01345, partial [Bryobacteraceae bacterium]|nr:hypothetical protein [Bryobacteraceae bacterium]
LFWWDQDGGARTGTASSDEADASENAGRGNWPEAVRRTASTQYRWKRTGLGGARFEPCERDSEPLSL